MPQPFHPKSTISLALMCASKTSVTIFDTDGHAVRVQSEAESIQGAFTDLERQGRHRRAGMQGPLTAQPQSSAAGRSGK